MIIAKGVISNEKKTVADSKVKTAPKKKVEPVVKIKPKTKRERRRLMSVSVSKPIKAVKVATTYPPSNNGPSGENEDGFSYFDVQFLSSN